LAVRAGKKRIVPPSPKVLEGSALGPQIKVSRYWESRTLPDESQIVLIPYTSRGDLVHGRLQVTPTTQVQLQDRVGRPSLYFNMTNLFPEFLTHHKAQLLAAAQSDPENEGKRIAAAGFPPTMEALLSAGILLRLTGAVDPEGVGFSQWRLAFYADDGVEGLNNLLLLLDAFIIYKVSTPDFASRRQPPISIFNQTDIALDRFMIEKSYPGYLLDPPAPVVQDSSFHVFAAYPPDRVQVVIGVIYFISSNVASVTFRGALFNFGQTLNASGIPGSYFNHLGNSCDRIDDGATYTRVLGQLDFSDADNNAKFWRILADGGFHDTAICWFLTNEGAVAEAGAVGGVVDRLKANPRYRILTLDSVNEANQHSFHQ
jgi:hypothetical protein